MENQKYKRIDKSGMPPGSLMFLGDSSNDIAKVTYFRYNENAVETADFESYKNININNCGRQDKEYKHWIIIQGVNDLKKIEEIGKIFNINTLVLEDITASDQRPKIDFYDTYVFVVLRQYNRSTDKNRRFEQISLILTKDTLITFSNYSLDFFRPIIQRLQIPDSRFLSLGVDYLFHSVIDLVVDNYFAIVDELNDQIDIIEDIVIKHPDKNILVKIKKIKRNLLMLLKNLRPMRELIRQIRDERSELIADNLEFYIRDVHDHILQIIDSIETMRDMVSAVLDIYLSSVSNKTNEIMKVLTILSSIFIPLTFIAGVYGMNFQYIPELSWKYGYISFWIISIVITIGMLLFFKKKKWL